MKNKQSCIVLSNGTHIHRYGPGTIKLLVIAKTILYSPMEERYSTSNNNRATDPNSVVY